MYMYECRHIYIYVYRYMCTRHEGSPSPKRPKATTAQSSSWQRVARIRAGPACLGALNLLEVVVAVAIYDWLLGLPGLYDRGICNHVEVFKTRGPDMDPK